MIVSNTYYDYYTTVAGHQVIGKLSGAITSISLYKITNNYEELSYTVTFDETVAITIVFDGESDYRLDISYSAGIGTNIDSYNIKYYPSMKESMLNLIKDSICESCGVDTSCCSNGNSVGINTVYNNAQLSAVSIDMYMNRLFPENYTLEPLDNIDQFYNTNADLTFSKFLVLMATLTANGTIPYSNIEFAMNLALRYIVLYNAELTLIELGHADPTIESVVAEIAALKTAYMLTDIVTCFTALNLSMYEMLYADYSTSAIGGTTVAAFYTLENQSLNIGYTKFTHSQGTQAKSVTVFIAGWATTLMWTAEAGVGTVTDELNEIAIYSPSAKTGVKLIIGF